MAQDSTAFMRSIDADYRAATGLTERRFYTIFHSRIEPCPVMIIGYNPAGNPAQWTESTRSTASASYFENGEHDYVDCDYIAARAMRRFLIEALGLASSEQIRSIPKTNLIFRVSRTQDDLRFEDGTKMKRSAALTEAKPFVERIIARVRPRAIILEGKTARSAFVHKYCGHVDEHIDGEFVETRLRGRTVDIYQADRAYVDCLDTSVLLVSTGHPSMFGDVPEWALVKTYAKEQLRHLMP